MAKVTLDMETFKALASPTRLQVLRCLDERRKTLSELSKEMDLNKATVHEHLAILTATGLVKKRDDEGRKWIYYELTWQGERLLHPQETTTFAVLLGFGVLAAGGGVAMLGRAMQWWWAENGEALSAADQGPEMEGMRMADGEADSQEPQPSGSPSSPPSNPPSSPESQQSAAAAENGTALEDSGDTAGMEDSVAELDPDGVIGVLLLLTAILMAVLAFAVRRKAGKR